ncbi:tetratricopeptide repeat protein [Aestuariivivens sediminicola]|uniref:tetratricopeptide repeat protein n=1 Tax=Aestuariivivens sediminicola TaxID=2913560 RepID=UPI001F58E80C|nr:tetratricopeptide repeat protein [Aestuariivivens sediminicola]
MNRIVILFRRMKMDFYLCLLFGVLSLNAQEKKDKAQELALRKANNYVYEGNKLFNDDFIEAEMAYRKAISEQPSLVVGNYNLGNSYYEKGNYDEALFRQQQALKHATSKLDKHRAYHNIGNILMQNKKCQEAVEAFKNALRNDPTDDETRYNLGLAKICAEQQKDQQEENKDDENKDKKEDNKDNQQQDQQDKKDQEGDNKEDEKNQEGDQDKKEGDEQKDEEGKPKDDKQEPGKDDDKEKQEQQPKPKPGQLSPQQVKSLLEAMNNQEQKVQDKINAEKQKGIKVKTDKDW